MKNPKLFALNSTLEKYEIKSDGCEFWDHRLNGGPAQSLTLSQTPPLLNYVKRLTPKSKSLRLIHVLEEWIGLDTLLVLFNSAEHRWILLVVVQPWRLLLSF